ncbi:MAG: ParB family protein [Brachybacterium sp.]|uniref:ParB family protein n=2 Tax=Brachybacterium TaxID=43668 RepID=UPI003FD4100F
MSDKPARKRSAFGSVDPVAPRTETAPPPLPVTEEPKSIEQPRPTPRKAAAKTKVGFFMPAEEADRARAALVNTFAPNQEGPRTFSDLIRRGLLAEVERLERQYNNGKQWAPVQPGQVPTGRPRDAFQDG